MRWWQEFCPALRCSAPAAPEVSAALFPSENPGALYALSQTGLRLFMFLIGVELDPEHLRRMGRAAIVISMRSDTGSKQCEDSVPTVIVINLIT
ncbi:MAG: hypothetical protein U0Z53_25375 [Blastocatellia bacterium]